VRARLLEDRAGDCRVEPSLANAPPESRYPKISDGMLKPPSDAGWPKIPGLTLPPPMLITYRLDFGPEFATKGIVAFEPPIIGKAYVGLVPTVDEDGNARAGIRMPPVQVPIATYSGWNFRTPPMGSPDQLSGEAGAFYPFARRRAERTAGDSRRSIEERYMSRDQYLGKVIAAARQLIGERFWLVEDLPDLIDQAGV